MMWNDSEITPTQKILAEDVKFQKSDTKLIIVRHGNTFNPQDVILRVGARTDLPLTEEGHLQGVRVGQWIKEHHLVPDVIFCAPLMRTLQTADEILRELNPAIITGPVISEFLTELDYGEDDGQPENDVILRLGAIYLRNQITQKTTISELRLAGMDVLRRWDQDAVIPEGWEHLIEYVPTLITSWKNFADMLLERWSGKTVIAVTSNGIARFSRYLLPEESYQACPSLKLATGALGVYSHDGYAWNRTAWNVKKKG